MMYATRPGLDALFDGGDVIPESPLQAVVPPESVGRQIPIPQDIVGGTGDQTEPFFTETQRLLKETEERAAELAIIASTAAAQLVADEYLEVLIAYAVYQTAMALPEPSSATPAGFRKPSSTA